MPHPPLTEEEATRRIGLWSSVVPAVALLGLVFTAVFGALIAFNYIAQTALVPAAVRRGHTATVEYLAMASPTSICWSIEMFGYGFLGLASICVTPMFRGHGLARATNALLWANGAFGVVGAALTAIDARWVLTPAGLGAFLAWNVVVLAMVVVLATGFRAIDPRARTLKVSSTNLIGSST